MIDLEKYTANGKVRNLSGKDRGLDVRNEFGMDDLDRGTSDVIVRIPHYVYAVSTSFFCGMFGDSYETLGRDGLLKKYKFDMPEELWPQIEQGLERCAYQFEPLMTAVG